MGCCGSILKFLLYIFSVVFFLTGVALIATGSYIYSDINSYVDLIDHEPAELAIVFIATGCIVIISTFFGCFDLCKSCGCLIWVYTAFLCAVLVLEGGTGITAFVYRDNLNETVLDALTATIVIYDTDGDVKDEWDSMQKELECCGIGGPLDWKNLAVRDIPASCCMDKSVCDPTQTGQVYTDGCNDKAFDTIDGYAVSIASVGVVFAIVQIAGIIISFLKGACCCC